MKNMLRFERGELKKRARQGDILQELIFDPEATDVCDIEIITLRQHLKERAQNRAFEISQEVKGITEVVERLLHTEYNTASEFVDVGENYIKVGINAPVIDDAAVDQALMLLIQVDDITKKQFVTFGEVIQVYD